MYASTAIALATTNAGPRTSVSSGMVAAPLHGRGLGTLLLDGRLREIREQPDVVEVAVDTSQVSAGFFKRHGFVVRTVVADGHGEGIDSVRMRLVL